jgi:sec-independent protein translocase protein TatA
VPSWIGPWELAILVVILLLIFGPKRLPDAGRSLGRGIREFKDSITGSDGKDRADEPEPRALEAPAQEPAADERAETVPAERRERSAEVDD